MRPSEDSDQTARMSECMFSDIVVHNTFLFVGRIFYFRSGCHKVNNCRKSILMVLLQVMFPTYIVRVPLGKHAYSNILKILQSKKENFPIKKSDIFHISSLNIDCGFSLEPPRRGGSNVYPQSMFFNKVRKIMHTPVNPSFTI